MEDQVFANVRYQQMPCWFNIKYSLLWTRGLLVISCNDDLTGWRKWFLVRKCDIIIIWGLNSLSMIMGFWSVDADVEMFIYLIIFEISFHIKGNSIYTIMLVLKFFQVSIFTYSNTYQLHELIFLTLWNKTFQRTWDAFMYHC